MYCGLFDAKIIASDKDLLVCMLNTYPTLYCACMYTLPSNNQLSSLLGVKRMESHDFSVDIKYVPKLQPF